MQFPQSAYISNIWPHGPAIQVVISVNCYYIVILYNSSVKLKPLTKIFFILSRASFSRFKKNLHLNNIVPVNILIVNIFSVWQYPVSKLLYHFHPDVTVFAQVNRGLSKYWLFDKLIYTAKIICKNCLFFSNFSTMICELTVKLNTDKFV